MILTSRGLSTIGFDKYLAILLLREGIAKQIHFDTAGTSFEMINFANTAILNNMDLENTGHQPEETFGAHEGSAASGAFGIDTISLHCGQRTRLPANSSLTLSFLSQWSHLHCSMTAALKISRA